MMTLLIHIIFIALPVHATFTELFHAECPKIEPVAPTPPSASDPSCKLSPDPVSALQQMGTKKMRLDAFGGILAQQRSQDLGCLHQQATQISKDQNVKSEWSANVKDKLIAILAEKKQMKILEPAIARASANEERKQYKNSRLTIEALKDSIPFAETRTMQTLIASVTSQEDYILGGQLVDGVEKHIQELVVKSLPAIEKELKTDKAEMDKGIASQGRTLSRLQLESLAQDMDLIATVRKSTPDFDNKLKSAACEFDANYGTGAQNRDIAIDVASLAAGGALALPRIAAAKTILEFSKGATIGTRGLRTLTIATVAAAPANEIYKKCTGGDLSVAPRDQFTCEPFSKTTLHQNDCLLSATLNAIGAKPSAIAAMGMVQARIMKSAELAGAKAASRDLKSGLGPTLREHPDTVDLNDVIFRSSNVYERNVLPDSTKKTLANLLSPDPNKVFDASRELSALKTATEKYPRAFHQDLPAHLKSDIDPYTWANFRNNLPNGNHSVTYFDNPKQLEHAIASFEQAFVEKSDKIRVISNAQDKIVAKMTYVDGQTKYLVSVCIEKNYPCRKVGDVLSFYPVCGPSVIKLDLSKFRQGLSTVSEAFRSGTTQYLPEHFTNSNLGLQLNPCK